MTLRPLRSALVRLAPGLFASAPVANERRAAAPALAATAFVASMAAACAGVPGEEAPAQVSSLQQVEGAYTTNAPDLDCTLTGPTLVDGGSSATFQVSTTNLGKAKASSPRIDVTLPAGYSVTGVSGGCAYTATTRSVRCSFSTMNGGAVRAGSYTVQLPAQAGTLAQTATASFSGSDGNPSNNSASLSTQVRGADLSVTLAGPSALSAGSSDTFVATVENTGPVAATGVWLTLNVPDGTWPVALPGCVVAHFPTRVRCNLGTVAAGAVTTRSVTYGFPYTAGTQTLTASAVGSVAEPAPLAVDNSASVAVSLSAQTPVAVALSLPAPQQMSLTNCFGDPGDFGSFAACDPAWIQGGVITLLDGGVVDTGTPDVTGTWTQPSGPASISLEFRDAATGDVLMTEEGFGVASNCFEGLNYWPGESGNRGAFQLCTL